jgi:hypothetical protein
VQRVTPTRFADFAQFLLFKPHFKGHRGVLPGESLPPACRPDCPPAAHLIESHFLLLFRIVRQRSKEFQIPAPTQRRILNIEVSP